MATEVAFYDMLLPLRRLILLLTVFGYAIGQEASFAQTVGIYHWSGRAKADIAGGLRDIVALNSRIARFTISPRMAIDNRSGKECIAGFRLSDAFNDEALRDAVADRRLRVVMITAYDGASFPDCQTHYYLSPAWYTPENTGRLTKEYGDFVYLLHKLYGNSLKTFLLLNWEGDNAIYCGSVSLYATSAGFRDQCQRQYPFVYGGSRSPNEAIEAMVLWTRARKAGIDEGRLRAAADGLGELAVQLGVEFATVRMMHELGLPDVLRNVIPRVECDAVSYSAYESLGRPNPSVSLREDLATIRGWAPRAFVMLGEIGYSRRHPGGNAVAALDAIIQTAIEERVRYVVQWNLYDDDPASDFGLFDLAGQPTELFQFYRRSFGDRRQSRRIE